MRISTRTKSRYLRAADVGDESLAYTVRNVVEETMQNSGETKLVIYFREIGEGLVLNKTNERRLADYLGDETTAWAGRRIALDTVEVDSHGDLVRSIRARRRSGCTGQAHDQGLGEEGLPAGPGDARRPRRRDPVLGRVRRPRRLRAGSREKD
jgi:hypothetical protein